MGLDVCRGRDRTRIALVIHCEIHKCGRLSVRVASDGSALVAADILDHRSFE